MIIIIIIVTKIISYTLLFFFTFIKPPSKFSRVSYVLSFKTREVLSCSKRLVNCSYTDLAKENEEKKKQSQTLLPAIDPVVTMV